ncbi:MAG: nucleotidyltransferase family protein [Lachnospiraceae bacterium]|nr:nucleotidyltransferase family protein [Lachnospiraceae bacterium]
MKVTAIISEYNPFTNGHAYLLKKISEELDPDFVISVMSGDFVQRGECAMWDKYTRARIALECGMDMVIELPFAYASGSAFDFATGAVNLINSLRVVDTIAFGAETTDARLFEAVADILVNEPPAYKSALKIALSKGLSFPAARQEAVSSCITDMSPEEISALDTLLSSPNNILALEYISAIKRTGASMNYHIIERKGAGYNAESLDANALSSALSVRKKYLSKEYMNGELSVPDGISSLSDAIPAECLKLLIGAHRVSAPITCDMLDAYLAYAAAMTDCPEDIYGFTEGITGRFSSLLKASTPVTFNGFADKLHTKDTTLASVKRALLHLIAGYSEADRKLFLSHGDLSYACVLGARKAAGQLIKAINELSDTPIISKKSEAIKKLRNHESSEALLRLWSLDIRTTFLYNSLIYNAYGTVTENPYSAPLIMV